MRSAKLMFFFLIATLVVIGMTTTTPAFHDGGVGECGGCHSMHEPDPDGTVLLQGDDPSSACLNCHISDQSFEVGSSYHIATAEALMPPGTPPGNLTPGGDFGWIKKDYTWTVPWGSQSEDGDTHGHNIVAAGFNYVVDERVEHNEAPGGTFPNTELGCQSCHDPHGQFRRDSTGAILGPGDLTGTYPPIIGSGSYNNSETPGADEAVGVYRLLAGFGYENTASGTIGYGGVPVAVAPSGYNRSEASTQTRVAYGFDDTANEEVGWADWCGTCHGDFHSSGNYTHPTDETLDGEATNYNDYVKTGDLTGTFTWPATGPFLSLVPFAEGGATGEDYAALAAIANNDGTNMTGPTTVDLVTCLTCHRAHASGFEYALRWNPESELLTYDSKWPADEDPDVPSQFARGRSAEEMRTAYYDREPTVFASYQRSLCNKCHVKD